jgi:hypothetical protein
VTFSVTKYWPVVLFVGAIVLASAYRVGSLHDAPVPEVSFNRPAEIVPLDPPKVESFAVPVPGPMTASFAASVPGPMTAYFAASVPGPMTAPAPIPGLATAPTPEPGPLRAVPMPAPATASPP